MGPSPPYPPAHGPCRPRRTRPSSRRRTGPSADGRSSGMVGLGVARDPLGGQGRSPASSACCGRSRSTTRPGSPASCPRRVASASTPSPATCRAGADAEYRLTVDGARRPARHARPRRPPRAPAADVAHQGLPVRHRLAGARRAVAGRAARATCSTTWAPVRPPPTCASTPSTACTPRRSRWSRPAATTCWSPTGCSARDVTQEHGGPVRLYVAPMYGYKSLKWLERIEVAEQLDRPSRPRLLGAARLRHRRVGRRLERPRRRADVTAVAVDRHVGDEVVRFDRPERLAPLGQRHAVPHPPGHRDDPLRRVAVRAGRPPRAGQGHPRDRRAAPARARCSSPTRAAGATGCGGTSAAWPAGRSTTAAGCSASAAGAGPRSASSTPARSSTPCSCSGCIPVMLATGSIMRWFEPVPPVVAHRAPPSSTTGPRSPCSSSIVGHIGKALAEPVALRAMVRGHGARPSTSSATTRGGGPSCPPSASRTTGSGVGSP